MSLPSLSELQISYYLLILNPACTIALIISVCACKAAVWSEASPLGQSYKFIEGALGRSRQDALQSDKPWGRFCLYLFPSVVKFSILCWGYFPQLPTVVLPSPCSGTRWDRHHCRAHRHSGNQRQRWKIVYSISTFISTSVHVYA